MVLPAYMSPEQARGTYVDKRADIWSFGVVLAEMLTGRRLFRGASMADTLALVLNQEPDWNGLPADTPLHIRLLLERCLSKHPKERLRDIGDARLTMDETGGQAKEAVIGYTAGGRATVGDYRGYWLSWRQLVGGVWSSLLTAAA